ncbi:InlB B-repeat-containing protein [Lysinibacillus sp. FSL R7-0073]|uniref:InlB B-repeat-containing protein n=1 Tax=Lysinibacillus sp. FSL R7-0073 TaxID=2921669 RepID=UPI0030F68296
MKNDKQVNVALMLVAMLLIIVQPFLELQVVRAAVTTIFPSKIVTGTVYQGIPNSVDILEEIAGVGGYDSGDQTNTAYVKFNLPSNYDYSNAKLSLTPIPGSDSGGDISNLTINIGSSDDWIVTDGNTYPLTSLPSKKVGIEKDFSKPTYSFNNFNSPILLPIGDLLTEQNINDIGSSNIITLILSSPNMKDDYAVFNNISLVDFNTSPQVKHTVSFETDGGSAVPSQSVVNGGMATMPEVEPIKAGYTFGGWYKDADHTESYDFNSNITGNTIIYAKWNAQAYTVSFNTDGGSAVSNQSVLHGGKATIPEVEPTKAGYTFGGWYKDIGGTQVYDFNSVITEATTIYAKWNAQAYTVSFNTDGGSAVSNQSVAHGEKASEPTPAPTKGGYTFEGWYKDVGYTQTYDFTSVITENTTIYAKWNAQTYVVSFNTDGGSAVSNQSVAHGEKASEPTPAPTKGGYTFGGWYKDAGYTQTYDFTSVITENMTIYAKWNAQTYIVSFNTDEGSAVSNQSVAHGGKVSKPTSAPTKAGYTLGGWYTSNTLEKLFDFESSSITRNITIYAKWVSNVSPPTSNNSSNSDSFTPTTNTERIVVEVEGEDGVNLSKTPITRTTMPDGVIKDHVSMSENIAKETIEKAKQVGNDFARIIIPDTTDKVSEVVIEIPKSSLIQLSSGNIKLEMATANVVISIPDLSNFNDDLYFRLVPIKSSEQQHRVEERILEEEIIKNSIKSEKVHLIGRPMTIETNMQNRPVTLTLPLPKTITQEQLDNLAIFIEHSDGTKELLRGKVVDYQKDMQGLQFEVQKFSTFSILYLPEKGKVEEPTTNHVTHIPYIQGNSDGTFRPNASVTRAQMASMFARQLTGNAIPTSKATFTDTVQHDAKDAIEFVKNTGLFNGVTETSFHPNGFITRAQMAAVAARWIEKHCANNPNADFCKPTSQGRVFKDVSNNHWAVQAINTVNARGIMTGTMADAFDPEVYLTRAQAVKVLNRLFERQAVTELQQPIFKDVPSDHWAFNEIQEAAVKHIHSK